MFDMLDDKVNPFSVLSGILADVVAFVGVSP